MKRILLSLLLCTASVRAGDIFIFNSGASTSAMATTLTQAMVYAESLMSASGTVWFAEWIADNGATAVIDSGVSNLIYSTASASSEVARASAVWAAEAAIAASNVVFSAQDLAAARADITASNVIFSANDLAAARADITASNVVFSANDLAASQAAITSSNAIFSAQALAASQAAITSSNAIFSAQTAETIGTSNAAQSAAIAADIGVSNSVQDVAWTSQLALTSGADRVYAAGLVTVHADVAADTNAVGHVKLGTGLMAIGDAVITLAGANQMVPAATTIAWDGTRYSSLNITNDLSALTTTVTLSNPVPGFPYTLTAKAGAVAKGLAIAFSPEGTARPVGDSVQSFTIPINSMVIVTAQATGAGDYIYSVVPVQ